jgi:hypothetical protein
VAINRPTTKTIISTAGWGVPITDEVNALRTDVNALKVAPTWVNLPLSNGWTIAGGFTMQYTKIGYWVYTRGSIANGSNTAASTVATFPSGFRSPVVIQFATFAYATSWVPAPIDLQIDGRLTVGAGWPAGIQYLPIQIIFSTV